MSPGNGVDVTWHNGATGGFASTLALDYNHAAAVVVLANTSVTLDDIAISLLFDLTPQTTDKTRVDFRIRSEYHLRV